MTPRPRHQPLRLATLLTAVALALLGVGMSVGIADVEARSNRGTELVLGTQLESGQPDRIPFASTEAIEVQDFLDRINSLRSSRGVDPLVTDGELSITATAWATQMSQVQKLEHAEDLSLGISTEWRKLGENVGVAPDSQLDELFEAFVNSPTHLANLVDPSFDLIGIGIVHRDGKTWMTQRFMDVSPRDAGVILG